MYSLNDYNGITEATELRASAIADEDYETAKAAIEREELEAERIACALIDAEEDALIFQARAKDDDTIEARIAAAKANPVTAALDGWIRGQIAAQRQLAAAQRSTPRTTPIYAEIANGLFVRVGTGAKRRRAA